MPYRLKYSPTIISTIVPLRARPGVEQVFTITGENMFNELQVFLSGCQKFKWLKEGSTKRIFSCFFDEKLAEKTLKGFIRYSAGSKPDVQFTVLISNDKKDPVINQVTIKNPQAGKVTGVTVNGENLTGDYKLDERACNSTNYKKASPSRLEFECEVPYTIRDERGRRPNDIYTFNTQLTSASANTGKPVSFQADYQVKLFEVEPQEVTAGHKQLITLKGENLDLARAVWMEKCDELNVFSQTENEIKLSCIPQYPDRKWSAVLPDYLKKDFYRILIKDISGGELLGGWGVYVDYGGKASVSSVNPVNPLLDKENTFTIKGINFPAKVEVEIENCDNPTLTKQSNTDIIFSCTPHVRGGDEERKRIKEKVDRLWEVTGLYSMQLKNIDDWEKTGEEIFRFQQRVLRVYIPPRYAPGGKKMLLFEKKILPVSNGFLAVKNALSKDFGGDITDQTPIDTMGWTDEDYINYFLKAKGNYDDAVLESTGWKKVETPDGTMYEPILCTGELRGLPALPNIAAGCLKKTDWEEVAESAEFETPLKTEE